MSVSISEIIAGASVHAVPLAGECAGYLVLAAADQAVAAPRRIGPGEVHLFDDGTVRVEGARAAAESDAEGDLRALLDALLLRASSATPALLRASRRAPGRGIASLVREIETALIPVNRAAAHRALARLERETERARHAGRLDAVVVEEVARLEPERAQAPRARETPERLPDVRFEPPAEVRFEPPSAPGGEEIPSLFAPPVEAIAAYAAEIETRPEPIVVRRSAPPPPSPSSSRTPPPPTTPVFGTVVQSYADDEMEIEVVLEDDVLADDELTGVLVRSAPLEISAMLEASATPDATEPSPPVLEDELSAPLGDAIGEAMTTAPEPSNPESTSLLAEAAEMPVADAPSNPFVAEMPVADAPSNPFVAEMPVADAPSNPFIAEMPVADAPSNPFIVEVPPEVPPLEASSDPFIAEVSPFGMPDNPFAFEMPADDSPSAPIFTEPFDKHGETLALALAVKPVIPDLPPAPRLPMPKPRPSDVEDLLERMTQANTDGNDELRSSLKGLAGLEPTPPPPET